MTKEKKSSRSEGQERRHHKASKTRHRTQSEARDEHSKHRRSRSASSSKRKKVDQKEHSSPKATPKVASTDVQVEVVPLTKVEQQSTNLEVFADDKERMIEEIFITISEENVKKMTPDSLKSCTLEDLKAMCLEELTRMSSEEIIHVLSGKDPTLFQPTSRTEESKEQKPSAMAEEYAEQVEPYLKRKYTEFRHSPSSEPSKDFITPKRLTATDEQGSTPSVKSEAESDSLELCATQKEIDSLIEEEILNQTSTRSLEEQTKTELTDTEILELELRARIIRSLLRNHGMDVTDEEECIQHKENVLKEEENT